MTDPVTHGAGARRELIAFRIGDQEFCVDIMLVREIRGWTPATPLPRTPPFVKGVINLRGAVLPIIDLGARLGLTTSDPTARHVIMVVKIGDRTLGLLVDAVSDIINITDDAVQPTPDVACDTVKAFVRGLFAIEGRMISLIALDRVLPELEAEAA
jgi:purine-binding chemotaxis protein CheW